MLCILFDVYHNVVLEENRGNMFKLYQNKIFIVSRLNRIITYKFHLNIAVCM